MTASIDVDVHYVSVPTQCHSTRVQLNVHIEIIIIHFEHIGSHFLIYANCVVK